MSTAGTWNEKVLTNAPCPTLFRVGDEEVTVMLKTEVNNAILVAISKHTISDDEAYDLIMDTEYAADFTEGDEVHLSKDALLYERVNDTAPGTTYIIGTENECFADNIVLCKQAADTWVIADVHQLLEPGCTTHLDGVYFEIYPLS